MMAPKSNFLLADPRAFDRMEARLNHTADGYAVEILAEAPELSDEDLRQILVMRLALEPLSVGEPTAIRIGLQPKAQRFGPPIYLHQATVPYSGSRGLWKARPSLHTLLMLEGKAAEANITVEHWHATKEFDAFEERVRRRLGETIAALPLHDPAIEVFNAKLPDFSKGWLAASFEDLIGWRRRGEQIRERRKRRQAFDQSEPPIDAIVPEWKLLVARLEQAQRSRRRH